MKRKLSASNVDKEVLLAVAQHIPHVPATVPVAARLRTLSRGLRANAPQWPAVTAGRRRFVYQSAPIVFGQCAGHEHMPLVRWLMASGREEYPQQAFEWFAARGANDVVGLLLQAFPAKRRLPSAVVVAARAGKWETVELLVEHGAYVGTKAAEKAAAQGRLDILQWISQKIGRFDSYSGIVEAAVANEHLHILEWLMAEGYPREPNAIHVAVGRGLFPVVDWLLRHEYPLTAVAYECAMHSVHYTCDVAVLQELHNRNCPWNELTYVAAVLQGNFPILKWLRKHGCPWAEETAYNAAVHGKVEMLDWAIANGCPWNLEDIIDGAIESGQKPMLQWAIDHGWTITRRDIDAAKGVHASYVGGGGPVGVAKFLRLKMREQQRAQ